MGVKVKNGVVDFIINILYNYEKVLIIVFVLFINIVKVFIKDKKVFENFDEFIFMGGVFRIYGNCFLVVEFNYWVDLYGVDYVYKNLFKKIYMVGLDVIRKIVFIFNIIEFINRFDKKMVKYIIEIIRFYIDFYWE